MEEMEIAGRRRGRGDPQQRRVSARLPSLGNTTVQFRRKSSQDSIGWLRDADVDAADSRSLGSLGSLGSGSNNCEEDDSSSVAALTPWQASGVGLKEPTPRDFFLVQGSGSDPGSGGEGRNRKSRAKRADRPRPSRWMPKHWKICPRSFDDRDGDESFSSNDGYSSDSADDSSLSGDFVDSSGSNNLWDGIEMDGRLIGSGKGCGGGRRKRRGRGAVSARQCARTVAALASVAAVAALSALVYLVADEKFKSVLLQMFPNGGNLLEKFFVNIQRRSLRLRVPGNITIAGEE